MGARHLASTDRASARFVDRPRHSATRARLDRRSLLEQAFRVRPGGKKPSNPEAGRPKLSGLIGKKSGRSRRQTLAGSGATSSKKAGGKGRGGRAGSRLKGRGILASWTSGNPRRQRVVVKARVVRNRGAGGRRTLPRHVNYVERDGVDRDGGRGQSFGCDGRLPPRDVDDFIDSARDDRHHFRIIVTPERGADLELRQYTQSFMNQVEADLGTHLDWLAVEHHNTAHPHVHLVVRGVDERGADLVINRAYISEGLRERAQGLATQELGLRPELELAEERTRDLGSDRLTYLDRRLIDEAGRANGRVDVQPGAVRHAGFREEFRQQRIARLQFLERRGLATQIKPGEWALAPDLASELLARGQKASLVREATEILGRRYRFCEIVVYNKELPLAPQVVGEVADRRRIDEISDSERIFVASTDGKLYRIALSPFSERQGEQARVGEIVAVTVAKRAAVSNADRNVVRISLEGEGIYDAERHRMWARQSPTLAPDIDPGRYVANHLKRLEGLERRGFVERLDAERFRIPADLVGRLEAAASIGRDGSGIVRIERLSTLTLREQVRAMGPTWLDTVLVTGGESWERSKPASTVQRRLAAAARARMARLEARGLVPAGSVERRLNGAVLDQLYREELASRGAALARQYGERLSSDSGTTFSGTVERLEALTGRAHAVVANERGFVLVPATPALARQLGRSVELALGRSRGLSLERSIQFVALDFAPRTRGLGR
jgi:type IV secretory pathway VirD2 relaxase